MELKKLEETGKYLFHGSALRLDELEPRQSKTLSKTENKMVNDGEAAVAATPYIDIAIFSATVKQMPGRSSFTAKVTKNGIILEFEAQRHAMEEAKKAKGYVHVVLKENFSPKTGHPQEMDWRSASKIKPVKIFEVGFEDLPENIKINE